MDCLAGRITGMWTDLWKASVSSIICRIYIDVKHTGSIGRFLIKEPAKRPVPPVNAVYSTNISYEWHKLRFFTSWRPSNNSVILCFDLPPSLRQSLSTSLKDPVYQLRLEDPFAFHSLLIEEVIVLYDDAVWSWRDLIRDLEKVWIKEEVEINGTVAESP
jgi:hypothetical protein